MSRFQWFFLYYLIILNLYDMKTLSFPILVLMILMCFPNHLPAQEIPKIRPVFGVRYSANFDNLFLNDYGMDYWVLRSTPGLFLEYKNHDFQIGPANAHFINSPGWLSSTKLKNAMGFSFGYRYYPNEILKRMRMYAQLQVSQFWVKYTSHSLGSGSSEHKETAWCGYTSLGIDYRIYQRFHAFTGIGIGISSTFHNIFSENFYPHVMAGIDYRFGCLNKK